MSSATAVSSATDTTFADLGLPQPLLDRVASLGFQTPTPIQAETIPALMAGRDVTGIAQTGTGKTAAFGLPLLAHLDTDATGVQALVLVPTRELAIQVSDAIESFRAFETTRVLPVYGGAPYGPQLRALRMGVDVVVGTPGRMIDLLERGALDLSALAYLVLDEADEMLRMGFAEDVDRILSEAPQQRQTALLSATMPRAIRTVAREHLTHPVEVQTAATTPATATISQSYAVVPFRHKTGALARVLATSDAGAAVVFVRTRQTAEEVNDALLQRGVSAAAISGDVPQKERERTIERLRSGLVDVLVATDVAARGMDVERIGLVVNFDVPREPESYVHRIGRTGRAGRSGRALTFFTPKERSRLRTIERHTGHSMTAAEIPTPAQVSDHRARAVLAALPQRIEAGRLEMYRDLLAQQDGEDLLTTAAALLAEHIGDSGPAPRREEEETLQRDFEAPASGARRDRPGPDRTGGSSHSRRPSPEGTVYRIAVGHTDGVRPGDIVGAITGEGGLRGNQIGRISIFSRFSLVDIPEGLNHATQRKLGSARVAGRELRIREDRGPRGGHAAAGRPAGGSGPRKASPAGRTWNGNRSGGAARRNARPAGVRG